jgi:hypothetical protein
MALTPTQQALALSAYAQGMGPLDLAKRMSLDYSDVYLFLQNKHKEAFRRGFDPIPTMGLPFDLSSNGGLISTDNTIVVTPSGLDVNLTTGSSVPVISKEIQLVNTTVPQAITLVSLATQLYAVSLYLQSLGTAAPGHEVVSTITYTSPTGPTLETITVVLLLDTVEVVLETYPLMVLGGTSITLSTSYSGGATNDPYTISARLVQMP